MASITTPSTEPLRPATPTGHANHDFAAHDAHRSTASPPQQLRTQPSATLMVPGQAMGIDGTAEQNTTGTRPTTPATGGNASHTPSLRNAAFPHTQVVFTDVDFNQPPPLNYSLRTRKKAIFWFWLLIMLDCVCMPIGLYFGMWYGLTRDQLSANAVFSISTALLGTVSIVEYIIRFVRLWRKNSNCRVIGAQRHYLDWFHWNLSVGWFFVMIELIVGTCPRNPPIRLLAMPAPTMTFAIGCELLLVDLLRYLKVPAPCRISSLPMGAPLRPGIYAYLEDICAVDGSGGTEFRQRLNLRYQASKEFREMLHRLTLFWGFGAVAIAGACATVIFTIQRDAAYVIGWTVPFIWAGIWTAITIPWVQRSLKHEYTQWTEAKWKA